MPLVLWLVLIVWVWYHHKLPISCNFFLHGHLNKKIISLRTKSSSGKLKLINGFLVKACIVVMSYRKTKSKGGHWYWSIDCCDIFVQHMLMSKCVRGVLGPFKGLVRALSAPQDIWFDSMGALCEITNCSKKNQFSILKDKKQ